MRKALLATDASAHSLRAAHALGWLARYDPTMHVTVLHVIPLPETLNPAVAAGAPLTLPMKLEIQREEVEQVLEATVEALALPADRVLRSHGIGAPAEVIVTEARQGSYDLVVLGRRGLSPLKEILLGSVSQTVLHNSPCPVLIVP